MIGHGAGEIVAQPTATAAVLTFQSWQSLMTPEQTALWARRFALAYAAGLIVGLGWGGWRGALAGLLAVSAGANGVAMSTYAKQASEPYQKVTILVAGLGVIEVLAALWLAGRVADDKDEEGRSLLSLAH